MAKKKEKPKARVEGSVRPMRLPQVNSFLKAHGIDDVQLERGHGYFQFWGVPIDHWLSRVIVGDRLDERTLDQWLETYRQLEKQNQSSNPLSASKAKSKARGQRK
jgi:hypothetical protein